MIRQLPLFPLSSILFPGATLNMHIFEERYRLMIGRCLDQGTPFGVVLIREGDEVTEGRVGARPAEPYSVGTIAQIRANLPLEDGRYLLTAVGESRFRIQYVLQHAPYIVASVVELQDDAPAEVASAARDLRLTYERYWQAVALVTGVAAQTEELPPDPAALSYQLADRIQVSLERKQRWLEADLLTRLREINRDLRAELTLMPGGQRKPGDNQPGMGNLN